MPGFSTIANYGTINSQEERELYRDIRHVELMGATNAFDRLLRSPSPLSLPASEYELLQPAHAQHRTDTLYMQSRRLSGATLVDIPRTHVRGDIETGHPHSNPQEDSLLHCYLGFLQFLAAMLLIFLATISIPITLFIFGPTTETEANTSSSWISASLFFGFVSSACYVIAFFLECVSDEGLYPRELVWSVFWCVMRGLGMVAAVFGMFLAAMVIADVMIG